MLGQRSQVYNSPKIPGTALKPTAPIRTRRAILYRLVPFISRPNPVSRSEKDILRADNVAQGIFLSNPSLDSRPPYILKVLPLLVTFSFKFRDGLTQRITTRCQSQGPPLSYFLNYPLGKVTGHGGFILREGQAVRSREHQTPRIIQNVV